MNYLFTLATISLLFCHTAFYLSHCERWKMKNSISDSLSLSLPLSLTLRRPPRVGGWKSRGKIFACTVPGCPLTVMSGLCKVHMLSEPNTQLHSSQLEWLDVSCLSLFLSLTASLPLSLCLSHQSHDPSPMPQSKGCKMQMRRYERKNLPDRRRRLLVFIITDCLCRRREKMMKMQERAHNCVVI